MFDYWSCWGFGVVAWEERPGRTSWGKKVALTKLFLDMFQIVTTYFQIFSTSPSSRSHQQLADIRYHQKIVVFFFGSQWDPMVGLCHKPLKRCDFVRPRSSPRNVRRAHRWWMTSSKKTSGTWECHKNLTSKEGRDPQDPQDPSDKSFFTNWWKKRWEKIWKNTMTWWNLVKHVSTAINLGVTVCFLSTLLVWKTSVFHFFLNSCSLQFTLLQTCCFHMFAPISRK